MKRREMKIMKRKIEGSSSIEDRKRKTQESIDILKADVDRIEEQKKSMRDFFRRNLEAYTGLPEKEDTIPFSIPGSHREANRYFWGGVACVIFESLLAVWILTSYDISLLNSIIFGTLIAVVCSLIFDGGISFSLRHIKRKEEALRKAKIIFIWPSFAFFIVSFLILLLARSTTGDLAILLLPLFGAALWTATISVLLEAGALFSVREIVDWSHKESVSYASLEREQIETKSYKNSLESSLIEIKNKEEVLKKSIEPVIASILAIFISLFLCSCSMSNAQPVEKKEVCITKDLEIDLFIDVSQSLNPTILTETVENVWKSIPSTAEKQNVTKVRVFHFDVDGWNSIKKLDIDIPKIHKSDVAKDIKQWKPINDAINEKDSKLHKEEIIKIFSGIDKSSYLPPLNLPDPPCTDINGVMSRISMLQENKSHLAIVITDGVENCSKNILPIPKSNSSCLVVLVPEKITAKQKAKGKSEFESRKKELLRLYPWAKVISYFEL